MGRIYIDMWYGDAFDPSKHTVDAFFSDADCMYRGNIYDENGKAIGDYASSDSVAIAKRFGVKFI